MAVNVPGWWDEEASKEQSFQTERYNTLVFPLLFSHLSEFWHGGREIAYAIHLRK